MKRIVGKIDPTERQVNIWGGGFSGLILGYYLKNQGYRITIYEKSNKVGGKIQTKKSPIGLVEKGPNALYLSPEVLELLKDLKLEPLPATKKLKRLILINGKPRRPFQLRIFSKLALNVYRKPPLVSDGLTVADFFRPLIGTHHIQHYLSPIFGGLYATTAENLHFKTIFSHVGNKAQFESYWDFLKILFKLQKSRPKMDLSGSVSFEGGMQILVNRLAEVLKHDIKLNTKEPFRLKANTIICTDAITASELLREARPIMSAELARVHYQTLSSVTVFLKREIRSLQKAFGVLIPLDQGFESIGVINNKAVFPSNNQNVFSYTFISPKKISNEEVLQDIKLLNSEITQDDVEHMEFTHWDKALPVYDLQLFLAIKKLHQLAQNENNFALFGNYVAGISMREMISAARNFASNPKDYSGIA